MTKSSPSSRSRAGMSRVLLLASLVILGVAANYGYRQFQAGEPEQPSEDALVHRASRAEFLLNLVERGEVESSGSEEIRCEVKARNSGKPGITILDIVAEGSNVQSGDFLVRFDSSHLKVERTQQQIAVNTSEAVMIQAKNAHATAKIAETEYLKGTFKQAQQNVQSEIFVAEENLRRAQEYLLYSRRLVAKGYITSLQLEADEFAVEKAKNELKTARTKLTVLVKYTKEKELMQFVSDIVSSKAQWLAEKSRYRLEKAELEEIDDLIAKCEVRAPKEGQVKYAHRRDNRGNNDFVVEEGAVVREGQVVIRLPDSSNMQVKIIVNESVVDMIHEGMQASVHPIGIKELSLPGTVTKVNQYSEPTSWRSANVKSYAAYVRVDALDPRLREGMTAEVTIHCESLKDRLQVPVQAVITHGEAYYCIVRKGNGWHAAKVSLGPTNELFVVIRDGLSEDAVVAMNPRHHTRDVDLPDIPASESQQAVRHGRKGPGLKVARRGKE